jgi:diketogulonate reductase-like aldo/keto reductase
MERRRFGPTNSQVAVIGQGTWYSKSDDLASALATLRRGLDLGLTHIDTAEMYLGGAAEVLVAKAIVGRREEIFLVSKVLPEHASRYGTITACEGSLARLNTDWLDCYLLHWRGPYPLEDTIAAFEQLHREGKILSWGVSNFDVPDLEEILVIAGEGLPVCNQVLYHCWHRSPRRIMPRRARSHSVSWCGIPRSSRSRERPARSTLPKTRGPESSS